MGHLEVTKLLLEFDANPNIENSAGNFVLDEVCDEHSVSIKNSEQGTKEDEELKDAAVENMSVQNLYQVTHGEGATTPRKVKRKAILTLRSAAKRVINALQIADASAKRDNLQEVFQVLITHNAKKRSAVKE